MSGWNTFTAFQISDLGCLSRIILDNSTTDYVFSGNSSIQQGKPSETVAAKSQVKAGKYEKASKEKQLQRLCEGAS